MIERPGIENTLYEVYMSRNLEDEITDYPKTFGQDQFLEATLAQDVIYNSFTDEQKENVENKVKEACKIRRENELMLHCVVSLMSGNVWSLFYMIR